VARVVHRLIAVAVTNAKAKGFYPDGGGLYLRVTSTGSKSWILRFRRDGKTHDMGLGPVASISLARARELAAEANRQRLVEGLDPIEARDQKRFAAKRAAAREVTFKTCAEQMVAGREIGWRSTRHRQQWRNTLNAYVYPVLGNVAVSAINTELSNSLAAVALEFTILTAVRAGEALGARWDEIDLGTHAWIIPPERMKGGREHRVPLAARAIEILKQLHEVRISEHVFPGIKPGRSLSGRRMLKVLNKVHAGVTVHGFRSSFKDWASEMTSFPDHLSEAALAHVTADKVRAAYARSDLFEKRRKLMDAWAAYCGRRATGADVVQLRRTMQ
jgi:integrase